MAEEEKAEKYQKQELNKREAKALRKQMKSVLPEILFVVKKMKKKQPYTLKSRPAKIPDFKLESYVKTMLRLFGQNVRDCWDEMRYDYAKGNDLVNSKPWYTHSDESKALSVKYFYTESEYGF